jgi:hypothetical protein
MTLTEAKRIIGSIGFPSKMPGTSYGLSAHDCIAGKRLAALPGSVCASCYALRDRAAWSNAQKAYARRLAGTRNPRWVEAMALVLAHLHRKPWLRIDLGVTGPRLRARGAPPEARYRWNPTGFHRWHDSGDLQSVEHFAKIIEVCRQTPKIRHWLPTRESAIIRAYKGAIPGNLTIRVSATMIDGAAPPGWPRASTVHRDKPAAGAHECPAPRQEHMCGDCRACWSRDVPLVSYRLH